MSVVPTLSIHNVVYAKKLNKSIVLPISFSSNNCEEETIETKALLDTGAEGKFIDQNFVWKHKLET